MKVSVVIITRNESHNIGECLASVAFANEIIVVDQSSEDKTVAIARGCGAHVTVTADWPGFGIQKNRAIALATSDWVLSLDADERISPELAKELQAVMANSQLDAYEIPRLTNFCGQWIHHCGWRPDHVLRLFRRGKAQFTEDLVHERVILIPGTSLGRLKNDILHYSYPTPANYWRKLHAYSEAWARQRWRAGQRCSLTRAFASGFFAFLKSYIFRLGFMDRGMGLVVCTMQAQAAFAKYFTLYCLNQTDAINPKDK